MAFQYEYNNNASYARRIIYSSPFSIINEHEQQLRIYENRAIAVNFLSCCMSRFLCFIYFVCLTISWSDINAQINGCTDPQATNFNSQATQNDGSCQYGAGTVAPVSTLSLDSNLIETSGLIFWNDQLWSHNDNTDTNLYTIDTLTAQVNQHYALSGVVNYDWEEISQDSEYVYIGDFGNNVSGNRTDLKILRIEKNSLLNNVPQIDTLFFSYADQIDFTATGNNSTDYDCEAFIVSHDSIYLFTKQWVSNKTSLYVIPKLPGTYSATLKSTYDVQGMITGATFLESERLIVLCGYTNLLQPFLTLLYDYLGSEFFSGNKRKLNVSLPFHQTEGIATNNGLKYYLSNESFIQAPFINNPQKLHILDLTTYLGDYLNSVINSTSNSFNLSESFIYPNPASTEFRISNLKQFPVQFELKDISGKIVSCGLLSGPNESINMYSINKGIYFLTLGHENFKIIRN
jgi:hypothetical protein